MILTNTYHSQHLLSDSPSRFSPFFTRNCALISTPPTHFRIPKLNSLRLQKFRLRAYEIEGSVAVPKRVFGDFDFDFDSFLSLLELWCLVSSAIVSVAGFAANEGSKNGVLAAIGNSNRVVVVVCGVLMMIGGVAIGAWIRRRQWMRICGVKSGMGVDLVGRIEKLEMELRSSATVVRVLSRQLEKLGTRVRVTRQNLKDPIREVAQVAALAQKNSDATRALAVQSEILEKELGEIQMVLLAMQEQQQKQLGLILAIGKTCKLWDQQ